MTIIIRTMFVNFISKTTGTLKLRKILWWRWSLLYKWQPMPLGLGIFCNWRPFFTWVNKCCIWGKENSHPNHKISLHAENAIWSGFTITFMYVPELLGNGNLRDMVSRYIYNIFDPINAAMLSLVYLTAFIEVLWKLSASKAPVWSIPPSIPFLDSLLVIIRIF